MHEELIRLFDLGGRNALVTGATGALGSAAARTLAAAGAHVAIAGGNAERLQALEAELADAGGSVTAICARPESEEACERIVADAGGSLDILVAASGTAKVKPALELQPAEWDAVMDANVRQSWLMARAAGRAMIGAGHGGKILLVSSVRGRFATRAGTTAYAPSKAAIDMLTRSFATEWGEHGINVNAIAPTVFRSELTEWLFADEAAEQRRAVLSRIPIGRLAEPRDFAGAILFLCSAAGDYVTGEILNIDGGFSAN